jgi:hypothetical protein
MANKTGQGAKKKVGRPSKYSQELADEICAHIAEGRSLRNIIANYEHVPSMVTIFSWLRTNDEFLKQYTRAKEEQADTLADDIIDIADEVRSGYLDPNAGRVAGDLKKWSAMKLKPKKYGDKIDMTSDGKALPQPILAMLNTKANTTDDVIDGEIVDESITSGQISAPKKETNIMEEIND